MGTFGYSNTSRRTIGNHLVHNTDVATIIMPLTVGLTFLTEAQQLIDPRRYHDEAQVASIDELASSIPGFDSSPF